MDHLSPERIAAYVEGKLEEELVFHLETHMESCPECARSVRTYRFISEYAALLFGSWSAKKASKLAYHRGLGDALRNAALPDELSERLRIWAENFINQTRSIMRITLGQAKKRAAIIEDEWAALGISVQTSVFQPAPVRIRVRGDYEPRGTAVESIDGPKTRVTADPDLGRITVTMESIDPPWPLVILVPESAGTLQAAEFRSNEGEDSLIAIFEDLEDDEYILLLEET